MSKFAVNLTTIFTEVPFLERFQKAKQAGFSFVECQFPYQSSIEDLRREIRDNDLSLVLINLPAGNWESGERGLAIFPERRDEFRQSVAKGIEYAKALGVAKLHCLAGVLDSEADRPRARETYLENLKFAASEMASYGLTLLIEPINPYDMPGYFLSEIEEAANIIEEIGLPNVKIQFDFYHIQRIKGNLSANFGKYLDQVGHIQIADVPGRHEPGTGEIDYKQVLKDVTDRGYKGYIGLEYSPKASSEESFKWILEIGTGGLL